MASERAAKLPHPPYSLVEFRELRAQQVSHPPTLVGAAAGRQQLSDLLQRKADVLRLPDELDALNRLRREEPEAPTRARGARQQQPLFVVAHGVNAHAGAGCDFAYTQL